MVFGPNEQWAADLVEKATTAKWNRGTKYLMTIIDVLTKCASVIPLKNKRGSTVAQAFASLFQAVPKPPQHLQTDKGKEFFNPAVKRVLEDYGVHHFTTSGDTKANVVERFNCTFKDRLYRYFTTFNTFVYLPVLESLVKGYNASYHRSIGMAPREVTMGNASIVWDNLYGTKMAQPHATPRFRPGDKVRLIKKHRTFKKSYLPGWTEEIFVITRVTPGHVTTYKVSEWDGTPIKGTFYDQDLQKVHVDDRDTFRVEKIVKTQGSQVLMRWKGWPAKYDSWINKKDLVSLNASSSKRKRKKA